MSKQKQSPIEQMQDIAAKAGLVLMASAAMLGMVELTDGKEKILPVSRPAFAFAGDNLQNNSPNDVQRRDREEEASSHYVTYGTAIRTPSRTGKR